MLLHRLPIEGAESETVLGRNTFPAGPTTGRVSKSRVQRHTVGLQIPSETPGWLFVLRAYFVPLSLVPSFSAKRKTPPLPHTSAQASCQSTIPSLPRTDTLLPNPKSNHLTLRIYESTT